MCSGPGRTFLSPMRRPERITARDSLPFGIRQTPVKRTARLRETPLVPRSPVPQRPTRRYLAPCSTLEQIVRP